MFIQAQKQPISSELSITLVMNFDILCGLFTADLGF